MEFWGYAICYCSYAYFQNEKITVPVEMIYDLENILSVWNMDIEMWGRGRWQTEPLSSQQNVQINYLEQIWTRGTSNLT